MSPNSTEQSGLPNIAYLLALAAPSLGQVSDEVVFPVCWQVVSISSSSFADCDMLYTAQKAQKRQAMHGKMEPLFCCSQLANIQGDKSRIGSKLRSVILDFSQILPSVYYVFLLFRFSLLLLTPS